MVAMPSAVPALLLLAAALPASHAYLNCSLSVPGFVQWCESNCNHFPTHCPGVFCTCEDVGPLPPPSANVTSCRSLSVVVPDWWCDTMCNFADPFCPEAFCDCDPYVRPETGLALPKISECCEEQDAFLFYTADASLFRRTVDPISKNLSNPIVCANFPGGDPNGIAFEVGGDIFVADPVQSAVFRVSQDCNETVLITSWAKDHVNVGSSVAVANGGLYVGGPEGIYFVNLDINNDFVDVVQTRITRYDVSDIKTDPRYDCIWFVERSSAVKKYCFEEDETTTFLGVHAFGIPDIKGIDVSFCGLRVSATDSNQVWMCPEIDDPDTCFLQCNKAGSDGSSCLGVNNPWGIAYGCCCDTYVAQKGNGNIVRYDGESVENPQDGTVIIENELLPKAVAFYTSCFEEGSDDTQVCLFPSMSRTPIPSQSTSPTMSPSPSVSPSPSPTVSFFVSSDFTDFTTRCISNNECTNIDPIIAGTDSEFSRAVGFNLQFNFNAELYDSDSSPPDGQFFVLDNNNVFRLFYTRNILDSFPEVRPQLSEDSITILVRQQEPLRAPTFSSPWDAYLPREDPNASFSRSYFAARINCTGYGDERLYVLWQPSFCWDDPDLDMEVCASPSFNSQFRRSPPSANGFREGSTVYVQTNGEEFPYRTVPVVWATVDCVV